jgi:hypothetical protein
MGRFVDFKKLFERSIFMKRGFICILVALSMVFATAVVCFADGYGFVLESLSDSYNASKGSKFSVSFVATNIAERNGILSIDAEVYYDPAHIQYVSAEGIAPSKWGRKYFFSSSNELKGNKMSIRVILFYDGDGSWETAGATDDKELGFKLNFNVVTSAKTTTTINVPNETLEATNNTQYPTATPGLGTSYTLSLNNVAVEESSEASFDPFYSIDPNASEEEPYIPPVFIPDDNPNENTSTDDSKDFSEIITSSYVENSSQIVSDVSVSEQASEDASEIMEESEQATSETSEESAPSQDESKPDEKEEGVNIILWLVIACIIIAAVAVSVYIVRNKKDDMNPVNPG